MDAQGLAQFHRDKLRKVFEFLKAYTELRYPPVRDVGKQVRLFWLKDLPKHPSVQVHRSGKGTASEPTDSEIVLRLSRPTLTECPSPPTALVDWLKPGWQAIEGKIEVLPTRNTHDGDQTRVERFEDSPSRPASLELWQQRRAEWQGSERPARQSMAIFQTVYEWFGIREREAERVEILVGDGILNCPDESGRFNHPVLLQKLELEFEPEKRNPQFVFRKREQPPELYLEFLRAIPEINYQQISRCADELRKAEFSPLGDGDTEGFFRRLIQGVFPTGGRFLSPTEMTDGTRPTIRQDPVIFMRQRRSGPGGIFDLVLEDIPKRTSFTPALLQIAGLTDSIPSIPQERSPLTAFANEDDEILLGKPANREQLEIAQQLARCDSVLVQGPPGTGKTHTIANLLGHFLAQGKRVLVTAHTPKALRVLRQQVVEQLQALCISVLQHDKRSQEDLMESVRKILLGLARDPRQLERDATRLRQERKQVIEQLREARTRLLNARQDEIREVVFGGKGVRPIECAKQVKQGVGTNDWVPSPVNLGETAPLTPSDAVSLYQTNARVGPADERELNAFRPDVNVLPTPKQFSELIHEIATLETQNLGYREELWNGDANLPNLAEFDDMLGLATKAIEFLRDGAPWQLEAVQAGRDGEEAKRVWISLIDLIESAWKEMQECNETVMAYGPKVDDRRPPYELLPIVDQIIEHLEAGKSFGLVTKLTMPECHKLIGTVRIGNRKPTNFELTHFRAVRAMLRMQVVRQELIERWDRQIATQGGPASSELGEKPEQVCRQFLPQIHTCLEWHSSTWLPLENDFHQLGFDWSTYLESTPPETGVNAELRRLRNAVTGDLGQILKARAGRLQLDQFRRLWEEWCTRIPVTSKADAAVTRQLRQSLREAAPSGYQKAYDELLRLKGLEPDLAVRRDLLSRLEGSAPAWATAIQNRLPLHSKPEPPGDPLIAWEWRQMHDELERRANVSLDEIQQRIQRLSSDLLDITAQLVEKLTWINLIQKTRDDQKQALGAYAAMRNSLTKTGKGVWDADRRVAARREMSVAKGAVPVWIMPLSEVAETFDPRTTRFDVVIIDEASQCDPTAMFALYLGRQTIIVGDDEQVTPVAVGVEMEQVQNLIQVHLQDIPHKELYDGVFSIYEFAQIAFGGIIRLVEHFRCAPNIIAFSNALSYKGEIRPLREASSIRLHPHVLSYRVEGGNGRNDEVNEDEAEAIASLICAAIEQPECATNEHGTPLSFGVVSLVGAYQAIRVDAILRQRLEPVEYKHRQILCGDAAQFQGDERDVMFISVVDSSPPVPPLPMRQEGPKKIFKKRFNVAASRARDQMWVVYSLNHEIDVKPGDYRRRLIEHALNPGAWEEELERQLAQVDPRSKEFEGRVLRRLVEAHFRVLPQYRVGGYRIDLVVTGNGRRLAIECDGERYHGPEKLQDDTERQAILERLGWQFVRIRGSIFFRDEDRAMKAVFQRLDELEITAELELPSSGSSVNSEEVTQRIIRRAQELRDEWRAESTPSNPFPRVQPQSS